MKDFAELTDADKLAAIERLAWWMGYTTRRGGNCVYVSRGSVEWVFRPFDKLEDARLLLEECERRPDISTGNLLFTLDDIIVAKYGEDAWRQDWISPESWLEWRRLTSTAEEQTLAVLAVAKLEQGEDGT